MSAFRAPHVVTGDDHVPESFAHGGSFRHPSKKTERHLAWFTTFPHPVEPRTSSVSNSK